MKPLLAAAAFLFLACQLFAAEPPANYAAQRTEAEKFFAEKSFVKANEVYRAVNVTNLPPAEQRCVLFRGADKTDLFRTHEVPRIKAVLDTMKVF